MTESGPIIKKISEQGSVNTFRERLNSPRDVLGTRNSGIGTADSRETDQKFEYQQNTADQLLKVETFSLNKSQKELENTAQEVLSNCQMDLQRPQSGRRENSRNSDRNLKIRDFQDTQLLKNQNLGQIVKMDLKNSILTKELKFNQSQNLGFVVNKREITKGEISKNNNSDKHQTSSCDEQLQMDRVDSELGKVIYNTKRYRKSQLVDSSLPEVVQDFSGLDLLLKRTTRFCKVDEPHKVSRIGGDVRKSSWRRIVGRQMSIDWIDVQGGSLGNTFQGIGISGKGKASRIGVDPAGGLLQEKEETIEDSGFALTKSNRTYSERDSMQHLTVFLQGLQSMKSESRKKALEQLARRTIYMLSVFHPSRENPSRKSTIRPSDRRVEFGVTDDLMNEALLNFNKLGDFSSQLEEKRQFQQIQRLSKKLEKQEKCMKIFSPYEFQDANLLQSKILLSKKESCDGFHSKERYHTG